MTLAARNPNPADLARPATTLRGVGPERGALLARLEIHTVQDLLLHRPSRHEDRRRVARIGDLRLGQPAIVHGTVVACGTKWFHHHTKSIFEIILEDGSGRLCCRWWNLPYLEKYFRVGDCVLAFGKPVALKPRTIEHPETEVLEGDEESFIHLNRITPVYPLTEGMPQRWLRALIWRTVQEFSPAIPDPWAAELKPGFPPRAEAIRLLHFPDREDQVEAARRRLALDEFIELQLQIRERRRKFEANARALPCGGDNRLIKPFLARLGFKLTAAQTRVLRELRRDMTGAYPMRRLLQGDVGSGKTLVAACCALMALESGYEVALMAPTEILAEQHCLTLSQWFHPLGLAVDLRTGSHKTPAPAPSAAASRRPDDSPSARQPHVTVGTHALIESGFTAENLGLVIIDEQHRFGVAQREHLVRKGRYPHLLVMTATPIPRTLGLTLYGELDVSIIDQMPPGRGSVRTFIRTADKLPKVWEFLRQQLAVGRQAYVVYPRVEETASSTLKAVTREFGELETALAPFKVGLLHGRLRPAQKEQVMDAFRQGQVRVLLATSLIEVGVDVPNATIMLIENAEQFGLAQLHQLRGRIGRGAHESYCILVAAAPSQEARRRLHILEATADGFEIAEADLKLRGPGELLGRQQSGVPKFRFGDLNRDLELIREARRIAEALSLDRKSVV